MHLQESGEMYLETILRLSKKNDIIRAIDIGEEMGYSKPSVSRAIGLLKRAGYVVADKDGHLSLTESGKSVAEKIYERHTLFTRLLITFGVDEAVAVKDACKMEHAISDVSFEAIKKYLAEKMD